MRYSRVAGPKRRRENGSPRIQKQTRIFCQLAESWTANNYITSALTRETRAMGVIRFDMATASHTGDPTSVW